MGQKVYQSNDIISGQTFWNVFKLSPREKLDKFPEMCFHIFIWSFASYLLVHLIASLVALINLRKHKMAIFAPLFLIGSGFITPFMLNLITSAAIAGVYRAASFGMTPLNAFFFGVGQTFLIIVFGYTRILATL